MQPHRLNAQSDLYNPEMPDASNVMASLLCVTTTYAHRPSYELAKLALRLAETLTAPEYAETELICQVSKRIHRQWRLVVKEYEHSENNVTPLRAGMY